MIVIFKKKTLLVWLIVVIVGIFAFCATLGYTLAFSQPERCVVVLDAGHGGRDNGVTGVETKNLEKTLNLDVAMLVKENLEKAKIKVVMTRKDDDGLYGSVKSNFKNADMKKRKEIINNAHPDLVVSIHMNKYPSDSSRRGAQVFFEQLSPESKELAKSLQSSLNTLNMEYVKREFPPLKGEYYILKCSKYTSAIVECGFLSNAEDDMLLNTEQYRQKIAFQIYSGIIGYLSLNTSYNSMEKMVL